ncbi:MAG: hypothetical protein K8S16_13765, partial [Bacteroidales bacterium]|nr:hypothetical protein [Bacteroidales bacterium]
MKKIITLVFIILATVQFAIGQTATVSLADYTTIPGQVIIPVDYTNFVDIGAITLFIEYDQSVASYVSFTEGDISGVLVSTWQSSGSNYILGVSWSDVSGLTSSAGTLIELVFNYTGGSTALDFQSNCELGNLQGFVVPAIYTDGSISPDPNAVPVTIVSQLDITPASPPNNYVEVPVEANFSNVPNTGVGSFNFEIEYDNTILTFDQITETFEAGFTVNTLTNPARVSVVWTTTSSTSGSTINGLLFKMKFTYDGGNSDLSFVTSACEIADFEANQLSVVYTDGMVTQDPLTMTNIIIGSIETQAGTTIYLPVTVKDFTFVGSFDYCIGFNSQVLEFVELTNIHADIATGILYNAIMDNLTVAWSASTAGVTLTDNETLFEMKFNYSGSDQDVVFNEQSCSMSDYDTNPILAFYVSGEVTELPGSNATVKMDTILSPPLNNMLMPVEVTGFDNIGAITLQIEFDNTLLNYVSVVNIHSELSTNGSSLYNSVDNIFTYTWSVNIALGTGVDIPDNDKLFDIQFFYNTGTTNLNFVTQNCEIADFDAVQLNVFYGSGQVKSGAEVEIKAFLQGP